MKTDYAKMPKFKLVELLEKSESIQKASERRFYQVGGYDNRKNCVAIPLSRDEGWAVAEYVSDMVSSLAGEGDVIGEEAGGYQEPDGVTRFELVVEWKYEPLLPKFSGFLVRYSYDQENGTSVYGTWGLLAVK